MAYDDVVLGQAANSKIIEITARSSGTGQALTGLAYGSVTYSWIREGAAAAGGTGLCVDATMGTYTDHGWKESNIAGVYQFGVPQAALATAANAVTIKLTATGMIDISKRVLIFANDLRGMLLGTDKKSLVSADAQDLSATLDVNAKLIAGEEPTTSEDLTAAILAAMQAAGTHLALIKAKSDSLTFTTPLKVDADVDEAAIAAAIFAVTGLTAGGVVTFGGIMKALYAIAKGKIAKSGHAFTFYDDDGVTALFTLTVSDTGRLTT